jgi:hypothetical protein
MNSGKPQRAILSQALDGSREGAETRRGQGYACCNTPLASDTVTSEDIVHSKGIENLWAVCSILK